MLFNMGRLKNLMEREEIDALVATSPESVYYTSGYRAYGEPTKILCSVIISREGEEVLLVPKGEAGCLTEDCWVKDRRFYGTYYIERPKELEVEVESETAVDAISNILQEIGIEKGTIGIEERFIPLHLYESLCYEIPKVKFKGASDVFMESRIIKTPEEISLIKKATEVSEKALLQAYEFAEEGTTELEVAKELRIALAKEWAQDIWIELGAGPRSWLADPTPSEYKMKSGDVLHIDLGARIGGGGYVGYCCDISRNAVVGEPTDEQRKIHEVVLMSEQKAIEAVRPGRRVRDIFEIGVEAVRKAGYPRFSRHNVGHGVGLEGHEDPYITATNDRLLENGMVITVEIPYHIYGVGGFNIEDIVLVTKNGFEYISTIDRDLFIL